MKIDVVSIRGAKGASLPIAFSLVLEDLPDEGHVVRFRGPVRVSGGLTNTGDRFMLTGKVGAAVEMLCDRCMDPFERSVEGEVQYWYVDAGRPESRPGRRPGDAGSRGGSYEDPDLRLFSGDQIDVTEEVREAVLLLLPGKRLCSAECRGICPECGVNRNRFQCHCSEDSVDPRLAALSRLLSH